MEHVQQTAHTSRRSPLRLIALFLLVAIPLLVAMVVLNSDFLSERDATSLVLNQEQAAPQAAQDMSSPAQDTAQADPVSISSIMAPLEPDWTYIGTARTGEEVSSLAIPWTMFEFIPWSQAQTQLSIPVELEKTSGFGDGTVFLLYRDRAEREFFLTLDRGQTWYPILKQGGGEPVGVYLTGNGSKIVVLMFTEPAPWQMNFWQTEMSVKAMRG